jgi:hypothetical protein
MAETNPLCTYTEACSLRVHSEVYHSLLSSQIPDSLNALKDYRSDPVCL